MRTGAGTQGVELGSPRGGEGGRHDKPDTLVRTSVTVAGCESPGQGDRPGSVQFPLKSWPPGPC